LCLTPSLPPSLRNETLHHKMLQQRLQALPSIPAFSGSILQFSWLEVETSNTRRNCRQPEGREAGAYAARWLAGWLGPTALSCLPRVLFLRNGNARESVCFSSGERRGSHFSQILKPSLRFFAQSPFFLSSSSPCHSLLALLLLCLSLVLRAHYSTFLRRCLCSVVCFWSSWERRTRST
jgi:hypothetical protein